MVQVAAALLPDAVAPRHRTASERARASLRKRSRSRRSLRPGRPGGLTRVQVGCGPANLLDDWWNVDIRAFAGVDEAMDATRPWPWTNLDAVYGEHFLEHLPPQGALRFVEQVAAALRPGGVLRLSTPSLEHVWVTHFDVGDRDPASVVAATYRANRAFRGWGHEFLYSKPMLERLLGAAGFRDVTFHAYGESDDPELRGIERHGGWNIVAGWPSVWNVEARATGDPGTMTGAAFADELEREFVRYVRAGH